jgi:hypothetical protein
MLGIILAEIQASALPSHDGGAVRVAPLEFIRSLGIGSAGEALAATLRGSRPDGGVDLKAREWRHPAE